MSRRSTRRSNGHLSTEDSWRMIEGENDSFDTSILPVSQGSSSFMAPRSSGSALPSQLSSFDVDADDSLSRGVPSQPSVGFGSQDSIRDFHNHQDDEDVILRQPFRPSLPSTGQGSSRRLGLSVEGPALKMPMLDHSVTESPRRRPAAIREAEARRRRGVNLRHRQYEPMSPEEEETIAGRVASLFLTAIFSLIDIFIITLNFIKMPLAFILAIYLSIGALILSSNMLTESLAVSLTPLCRVPGLSLIPIPFCPKPDAVTSLETTVDPSKEDKGGSGIGAVVDFTSLMNTQGRLKGVLEQSLETAFLPHELSRSRDKLDDLRTMILESQGYNYNAMSYLIRDYVKLSRTAGWDIEKLNTQIGTTVSSIIQSNRWVTRIIASHDPTIATPEKDALSEPTLFGAISSWWPFHPFTPVYKTKYEAVIEQYTHLAGKTIAQIKPLILLAQSIQTDLEGGSIILHNLHKQTITSATQTTEDWDSIATKWWSKLGGNKAQLRQVERQLALIQSVQDQRSRAVDILSALNEELFRIERSLKELEKQMHSVALDGEDALGGVPLSVHIGVIEDGVERLEMAKTLIDREAQQRLAWRQHAEVEGR